ncbi:MAG: 16S rRNA (uracil(1498)-N(3))-methyltransferase [Chitinivibrionales bacterium]|nr:16S rRNA (uracil(1498)-N(3))-methyltransferase [Chitinivibrionales bacterium]MBD3396107.1 16S rRNA (uracil(1498)-N(3))-methyltransferase [Chitinivibrionales bacterium]
MNMILLFPSDFAGTGTRVRLAGRRLKHVLRVHRAKPGDTLRVGLAGADTGTGTITRLTSRALEMEVALTDPPPPPLDCTLVLAIPRPKMLSRMLQYGASAGIKRMILVRTWRVDKSYLDSPSLEKEEIDVQLVLGLEQARDTVFPRVEIRRLFRPFAEDDLPEIIHGTRPIVAHPDAVEPCPRNVKKHVTLAIGPERGFTPFEIELLHKLGFEPVTLGPRPFRTENALPALIGRLF